MVHIRGKCRDLEWLERSRMVVDVAAEEGPSRDACKVSHAPHFSGFARLKPFWRLQALTHDTPLVLLDVTLPTLSSRTLSILMNTPFFRLSRLPLRCLKSLPVHLKSNTQTRRFNSRGAFPFQTYKMTAAASTLSEKLKDLSLTTPLPKYPNCYPEVNPVDIYRAHLTEILTKVTGVDAALVYPALQWTQTLEKGDLVLPIPALRVKGKKPPELAAEWVANVCNPRRSTGKFALIVLYQ